MSQYFELGDYPTHVACTRCRNSFYRRVRAIDRAVSRDYIFDLSKLYTKDCDLSLWVIFYDGIIVRPLFSLLSQLSSFHFITFENSVYFPQKEHYPSSRCGHE